MGEFRGVLGKLTVKPVTLPLCWVTATGWRVLVMALFVRQAEAAEAANEAAAFPQAQLPGLPTFCLKECTMGISSTASIRIPQTQKRL